MRPFRPRLRAFAVTAALIVPTALLLPTLSAGAAQSWLGKGKHTPSTVELPDVVESVEFYEQAFGLQRRFLRDEGDYTQMETGAVTLQFAAESAASDSGVDVRFHRPDAQAAAVQFSLAVEDVAQAWARATSAGATPVAEPVSKPWGQQVAYVRDLDGVLIELATAGD